MNADRWNQARQLFDAALDEAPAQRRSFVASACGDDHELRAMVEELLGSEENAELDDKTTWLDAGVSESLVHRAMSRDSLEGRRIGDFLIRDVLGTGGMATVFAAEQQHPKRTVALKIMRFGFASDAARQRFEYESEILASLRHPSIAQVYATGTYCDDMSGHEVPYFAMELIAGARPLTRYAVEERPDLDATLRLFVKVCRAVQHGHQRGFLHRDLKPQNILVDDHGRPKIIDFGIARAAGPDHDGDATRTLAGEILGTLHYMSPEQVEIDARELDVRSDVYSLGVILFELITARLPFDFTNASITASIESIRNADAPRPSTIDARVPVRGLAKDLDWVILTAMEKDRDRRYGSAADFADDVERMLADEPVRARPPSRAYLASKFVKRHRVAVVGAALFVSSLIAGVTATSINLVRAWNAEEQVRETLARVQLEADMSQAVNEFLSDTLRSPNPYKDGRDVKVVDLLDKVVSRADTLYADRPAVAAALKQALGSTYIGLGQAEQARDLLEQAVALGEEHLEPGHFQTVRAMQSLANCYVSLNRLDDAGRIARRAYSARRDAYGKEDVNAAACLYLIGLVAYKNADHEEAATKMLEAREILLRLEGPGFRQTVQSGSALGGILTELGRDADAEAVLRSTVKHGTESLGADDASTIVAANNLGELLGKQGKLTEAAKVWQDTLAPHERVYGRNHELTLIVVNNIASALKRLDRVAEAAEMYADLVARRRATKKHTPYTAIAYNNLGVCLESLDRVEEAEKAFGAALRMLERCRVPAGHWLTAVCRKGLAVVHTKQKRYPEAESALKESLAILQASKGDQRLRMRKALEALVNLYDAWDKPEQAQKVRARIASLGS